MARVILTTILIFFGAKILAADIPGEILDEQKINLQMCIGRYTNECVNTICPNSEDLDCTQKCQADAAEKCKGEVEQ